MILFSILCFCFAFCDSVFYFVSVLHFVILFSILCFCFVPIGHRRQRSRSKENTEINAPELKQKVDTFKRSLDALKFVNTICTFYYLGHPNKMFRFPSPDRPIFFEK